MNQRSLFTIAGISLTLIVMVVSFILFKSITAKAYARSSFRVKVALASPAPFFGGFISSFIPGTPACPIPHIIIVNIFPTPVPGAFPTIAISAFSGVQFPWRNYGTPGTPVMGNFIPAPVCLAPYPVFNPIGYGTGPF